MLDLPVISRHLLSIAVIDRPNRRRSEISSEERVGARASRWADPGASRLVSRPPGLGRWNHWQRSAGSARVDRGPGARLMSAIDTFS